MATHLACIMKLDTSKRRLYIAKANFPNVGNIVFLIVRLYIKEAIWNIYILTMLTPIGGMRIY
jgi:hypothetical protein